MRAEAQPRHECGVQQWSVVNYTGYHHHHHHIMPVPQHAPTAGAQAFLMEIHIWRTGHNPPRGRSAGVLTTANAAGTNGLTCRSKHGGAQDKKFLVTHPMTDQRCLTSVIALYQFYYLVMLNY
jgi:hypothetical protein